MKKALFVTLALLASILVIVGCSYSVDMTLSKIEVTSSPTNKQYKGEEFDRTGMVVTAYYNKSNFNTDVVDYSVNPSSFTSTGNTKVEVSYQGKTCELYVDVIENSIDSISVKTQLNKVLYRTGESLDLTGLVVEGTHLNGKKSEVTGYTTSPISGTILTTSDTNIVISYEGKTASQKIFVVDESTKISFEGIEVTSEPINPQYVGECLDKTGLIISGIYKIGDKEVKSVLTSYTTTPSDTYKFENKGTQKFDVSYTEGEVTKTTSFSVDVIEKPMVLKSIKVDSYKKDLYYNDFDNTKFNTQDLQVVIEVEYSNGKETTKTTKTDKDFTMYSPTISGGTIVKRVNDEETQTHNFTIYYTENGITLTTTTDLSFKVYNDSNYGMIAGKDLFNKVLNGTSKSSITYIEFCESLPEVSVSYTTNLDSGNIGLVKGYLTTDNKIYIVGKKVLGNPDCSYMFSDSSNFKTKCFTSLTDINGIENLDTSKVTNMEYMFWNCSKLTILDLSSLDTHNVTRMKSMFNECVYLTDLNISGFDTSNVTDMLQMFDSCSKLTTLDLSSFDTSKVTNMNSMFRECSSLTSLDLSSFDTSEVTNMDYMFRECSGLTTIYASSKWNTDGKPSSTYMFYKCSHISGKDGVEEFKWSDQSGTQQTDATYAKIYKYNGGGASTVEGYLTDISQKP